MRPRSRPRINPYDLFAYSVATVCLIAGVLVLVMPVAVPATARWTMGILLVLMGIYRIVHTRTRASQRKWEQEFEAFQEERDRDRPTEL